MSAADRPVIASDAARGSVPSRGSAPVGQWTINPEGTSLGISMCENQIAPGNDESWTMIYDPVQQRWGACNRTGAILVADVAIVHRAAAHLLALLVKVVPAENQPQRSLPRKQAQHGLVQAALAVDEELIGVCAARAAAMALSQGEA